MPNYIPNPTMQEYINVLKKYAEFQGRAARKEYWMFTLFNLLAYVALLAVGALIHFPFVALLYSLAVIVPSIAVGVRRLHDTAKSGWLFLIVLIPLVGSLILLFFFIQDSTPGDNQYGSNPKGA